MKKILSLLVMLAIAITLVGCELLPDSLKDTINGVLGNGDVEHTHEYTFTKCTAKCEKDGENIYTCSCGDSYTEPVSAYGHDFQTTNTINATCVSDGIEYISCTKCGESNNKKTEAYGHVYGTPENPSDIVLCTRNGCRSATILFPTDGKYVETLTFNFTKEHEAEIDAKYDEVLAKINAAAKYDPALHGFVEEGALAEEYEAVGTIHSELYDLILYAVAQRQIAEIDYYCDMKNSELEKTYTYMLDYYTSVIAKFYTLSRPLYDSCYREFYYYGLSEEEIKAFLFDSDALSNPEYTALKNRNNEIEVEFFSISSVKDDKKVLELYSEFVENNNKMAQLMGYDNYVEYAYENVYSRDYTYQEISAIREYVKNYLVPIYINLNPGEYTKEESSEYSEIASKSFFTNQKVHSLVTDYFKYMSFTSNPDKQYNFYDVLNDLVADGNMYRGSYAGAFVTYLSAFELPVAYFGNGSYSGGFTVTHEFGHYMNEIYNKSQFSQSYDLLEMHSQGNEILFLNYLKDHVSDGAYRLLEVAQIKGMLETVIIALCVDTFEQAVYLDSYTGYGSDIIMADNTISANEYDTLFSLILNDMGVGGLMNSAYWRYVTIQSPCYYVSYSISAISVLQLHEMANTDSLDVARDAYLKLVTYTDTNPDMTTAEILVNAGMYSFTDEELYKALAEYLN